MNNKLFTLILKIRTSDVSKCIYETHTIYDFKVETPLKLLKNTTSRSSTYNNLIHKKWYIGNIEKMIFCELEPFEYGFHLCDMIQIRKSSLNTKHRFQEIQQHSRCLGFKGQKRHRIYGICYSLETTFNLEIKRRSILYTLTLRLLTLFYCFKPVLYLDPVSQFPETTEKPGYFVRFCR